MYKHICGGVYVHPYVYIRHMYMSGFNSGKHNSWSIVQLTCFDVIATRLLYP